MGQAKSAGVPPQTPPGHRPLLGRGFPMESGLRPLPTGNPPPSAYGWKTLRVFHRVRRQGRSAAASNSGNTLRRSVSPSTSGPGRPTGALSRGRGIRRRHCSSGWAHGARIPLCIGYQQEHHGMATGMGSLATAPEAASTGAPPLADATRPGSPCPQGGRDRFSATL